MPWSTTIQYMRGASARRVVQGHLTLYFYLILSHLKIATFTLEQKVNMTTGVGAAVGRCVGNTPPVDDFPGLCLEDSPLGVRAADFVTLFPAGINAATT